MTYEKPEGGTVGYAAEGPAPTIEEIRRVRRHECVMHGHTFDVIQRCGSSEPYAVICSNCGADWGIKSRLRPWPDKARADELRARAERFLAETPEVGEGQ